MKDKLPWSTKANDYVEAWSVEEYRKASAEALGWYIKHNSFDGDSYYSQDGTHQYRVKDWHPDIDANQMLMVWYWLIKEGNTVESYNEGNYYHVDIEKIKEDGRLEGLWDNQDTSILLAIMKTFMEYQTRKKQK